MGLGRLFFCVFVIFAECITVTEAGQAEAKHYNKIPSSCSYWGFCCPYRLFTTLSFAYTGIGARKLQISHQIPEFPKMHQNRVT